MPWLDLKKCWKKQPVPAACLDVPVGGSYNRLRTAKGKRL